MAKQNTYTGMIGDWQRLLATLEEHSAEIPQLEPFRTKLGTVLTQTVDISKQQADLKASKQEMSKQFRKLTSQGQRLATVVRSALKEHYGIEEEKLTAFGVQPFRGRAKKADSPAPGPGTPGTPGTPGPTPGTPHP
jgi:chromosome segregation ATPase